MQRRILNNPWPSIGHLDILTKPKLHINVYASILCYKHGISSTWGGHSCGHPWENVLQKLDIWGYYKCLQCSK
jgi:hypothetical protein